MWEISPRCWAAVRRTSGSVPPTVEQGSVQVVSNFVFLAGTNELLRLPVVTNLPATGIAPTTATLNGQVLSTGGFAPTITLYYGPTDGGTVAGNWANSITAGVKTGSFSQVIAGLSPNSTYFYTASAANISGPSWASPSQSFTTPMVTLPQVTNFPATAIGANSATLEWTTALDGGRANQRHFLLRDQ